MDISPLRAPRTSVYVRYGASISPAKSDWPPDRLSSHTAGVGSVSAAHLTLRICHSQNNPGSRFQANWNEKTIAEVTKDQPQLKQPETLAAFQRNWEYMFVYCEVGYARARGSMHYFTFARPVSSFSQSTQHQANVYNRRALSRNYATDIPPVCSPSTYPSVHYPV